MLIFSIQRVSFVWSRIQRVSETWIGFDPKKNKNWIGRSFHLENYPGLLRGVSCRKKKKALSSYFPYHITLLITFSIKLFYTVPKECYHLIYVGYH